MKTPIFAFVVSTLFVCAQAWSQDESDLEVSIGEDELLIEEAESYDDPVVFEEGDTQGEAEIVIEMEDEGPIAASPQEPVADTSGEEEIILMDEDAGQEGEVTIDMEDEGPMVAPPEEPAVAGTGQRGGVRIGIDKAQLEVAALTKTGESVDSSNYGHAAFSALWDSGEAWELRLAGRIDGYSQTGSPDWDEVTFDYGESYLRYRGESMRVTLGAQTVIWGRIDEIPPTDRMSVQDLTRFVLDDLQDRRRARPMVRIEGFQGNNKFDLVWLPTFRGAELPDTDSIWYPVDRRRGELLGIESSPALSAVVSGALIDDDAPSDDGGFGLRYSRNESSYDFALTAQRGRQSVPYFRYNVANNTLEAEYPRAWSLGGDIGFEAAEATWRFEAAWISDVPATRDDMTYTEVKGVNWGAGVEFHPGDGDTRVNLQFTGTNLYDTPDILDRSDIYNMNGSVEVPFAQERWRARMRFFVGLDKTDVYVNPEITFLGWEPHELYLELHHFDGEDGTVGGYHQDHSLLSVGWRAEF